MNYLDEAKDNITKVMLDYRFKIEELEREEYEKVNQLSMNVLAKIPLNQLITHNGEYCKFIEFVPSKEVFRIFKDGKITELDISEVLNLSLR